MARAESYAAKHGIARAHGSYEALLADADVDAVYIALPNALHFEWTMRALAAGKHVLVEKPFTRKPEQVEEAWDEAERRGLVLLEGYMWRHSAQTKLLLSLIPEPRGAAGGQLVVLRPGVARARRAFRPGARRRRPPRSRCYCVGALRLVAGREPDAFAGVARLGRGGVDERFARAPAVRRPDSDVRCGFHGKLNMLEVAGTEASFASACVLRSATASSVVNGVEHRAAAGGDYASNSPTSAQRSVANTAAARRGRHAGPSASLDALLTRPATAPPDGAKIAVVQNRNIARGRSEHCSPDHRPLAASTRLRANLGTPKTEPPQNRRQAPAVGRVQTIYAGRPGQVQSGRPKSTGARHRPCPCADIAGGLSFGHVTPVSGTGRVRSCASAPRVGLPLFAGVEETLWVEGLLDAQVEVVADWA